MAFTSVGLFGFGVTPRVFVLPKVGVRSSRTIDIGEVVDPDFLLNRIRLDDDRVLMKFAKEFIKRNF